MSNKKDNLQEDEIINDEVSDLSQDDTTIMPLFSDGSIDMLSELDNFDGNELPLVAARNLVLFPGMTMPLSVGRAKSIRVIEEAEKEHTYFGLVLQRNSHDNNPDMEGLYRYGTIAEVVKTLEMPDGTRNVIIQGRRIFELKELVSDQNMLRGNVELIEETQPDANDKKLKAVIYNIKEDLQKIAQCVESKVPREINFAMNNIEDYVYLVSFLSATFPMKLHKRQVLLEQFDVFQRALTLAAHINQEMQFAKLKNDLLKATQSQLTEQQRQLFLHMQMHTIQEELGVNRSDIDNLTQRAATKKWPMAVKEVFNKELMKLQRINEQSPDYSVQYNYLQMLLDLPWGVMHEVNVSLGTAKNILERDHFGLEKVKERILEYLAVYKLSNSLHSPILCLYGPPGVGKTSLGKSIAKAIGRSYERIALGGLNDEAEIRGHRRTYIGAMPGRIISSILKAGNDNPVIVLDEIDKLGGNAYKGDPASALLEVLDPEQNHKFHDNYLDVDYDLSRVLFIATANNLSTIPAALKDRMEIIDISGYLPEEKVEIGIRHLVVKQKNSHGISAHRFVVPRKTLREIIERYTRESGVRQLDKSLAKLMRRIAWKIANNEDYPKNLGADHLQEFLGTPIYDSDMYEGNDYAGVVTGLAWTSVGGEILYVESSLSRGKGEKITITGSVGDVMKESAILALQYIKANADELEIPQELFEEYCVHIHCPEGAIPKDGPSAGITMVTSLASTFTQRKVRARIAMTGEITLRGRVLPIGGVKEKILAAKRAGITDIVLCVDNKRDVEDIKPHYLEGLNFHYVRDIREVLEFALLPEKVAHAKTFAIADKSKS